MNTVQGKADLPTSEVQLVLKKTREILHEGQVLNIWLFGSRSRGEARPFSDIDIMLEPVGDRDLTGAQISELIEALEESDSPYKYDVLHKKNLFVDYNDQIEKEKILLGVVSKSKI
jgi:predicted nucleotidyltransferase